MRKLWISLVILALSALVLSACGSAPTTSVPAVQPTKSSVGMPHDPNPMSDKSYDVHFIDSTLDHHVGVIKMAEQALKESTTVALKDIAQKTMTTTQKDIDWLKAYRQKSHPNAAPMKDSMDMGAMGISNDASKPFDQRFAMAMIDHHKGSITMAKEALAKVGHDDLKQFAQSMLTTEEAEVVQLEKFGK